MPKSNLSWDVAGTALVVTILASKKKLTFDLAKIFPDYAKMTDVQRKIVAYGAKQKLADKCAKPSDEKLTPVEMEAELKALWNRLVDGVWRIEGESRSTKIQKAWDAASKSDKLILTKLGLKPVLVSEAIPTLKPA